MPVQLIMLSASAAALLSGMVAKVAWHGGSQELKDKVLCAESRAISAARSSVHMAASDLPPGGADLRGGRDEERNAEVASLKRLFYSDERDADNAPLLQQQGFHADVAIARWKSQPFLPHQQVLLNIFQPEYTHMYESVIASAQPWYYMHLHLPGGLENLANPEFALPDDKSPPDSPRSLAPLHGTLMQIVCFKRLPDARLRIVVQGLGRAIVVRGTQSLPFARGDVQLLPDSEALVDAACASRAWLQQAIGPAESADAKSAAASATVEASPTVEASTSTAMAAELQALDWWSERGGQLRRRTALAAAAAEEAWWRDYEHAPYELRNDNEPPPAYSSFEPKHAARCVAGATAAVNAAVQQAAQEGLQGEAGERDEATENGAGVEPPRSQGEASDAVASALFEAVIMTPLDEDRAAAAEEAAEAAASLYGLEVQVWLCVHEDPTPPLRHTLSPQGAPRALLPPSEHAHARVSPAVSSMRCCVASRISPVIPTRCQRRCSSSASSRLRQWAAGPTTLRCSAWRPSCRRPRRARRRRSSSAAPRRTSSATTLLRTRPSRSRRPMRATRRADAPSG